jgi:hypothetical protein
MQIPDNSFVLSGLIQAIISCWSDRFSERSRGALHCKLLNLSLEPQPMDIAQSCPMVLHFAGRTTSSRDSALLTEAIL